MRSGEWEVVTGTRVLVFYMKKWGYGLFYRQ
jgi:hypothetical protein